MPQKPSFALICRIEPSIRSVASQIVATKIRLALSRPGMRAHRHHEQLSCTFDTGLSEFSGVKHSSSTQRTTMTRDSASMENSPTTLCRRKERERYGGTKRATARHLVGGTHGANQGQVIPV
jgi:hypothetical protein